MDTLGLNIGSIPAEYIAFSKGIGRLDREFRIVVDLDRTVMKPPTLTTSLQTGFCA